MDITNQIIKLSDSMNMRFSLHNTPVTAEEIFKDTGLMPAIARRADQLCSLCLGYGIGVSFDETEGAQLGLKAKFDDVTPNVIRLLCILDTLEELRRNEDNMGVTPMDELLYD